MGKQERIPLKIKPVFPWPEFHYFDLFWKSVEELVDHLFWLQDGPVEEKLKKIDESLPIVTWLPLKQVPGLLSIILVNRSRDRFASGTGRFFVDAVSRFALPGHHMSIESHMTVDFFLVDRPNKKFGLSHVGLFIKTPEEWAALEENLPKVAEEIRLTVHAVFESRRIISLKHLHQAEKDLLLQERLSSFGKRDSKGIRVNLFDQVHQWLLKAEAEKKCAGLWKEILPRMGKEEKISFDRDMFLEIQTLIFVYRDEFIAERKLSDVGKLACYQYFFKKKLQYDIEKEPFKRHIYLKVFRVGRNNAKTHHAGNDAGIHHSSGGMGVAIGLNLLNRYELLDANHIIAAVQTLVMNVRLIPNSYVMDARHETMRLYYLEVQKENGTAISANEFLVLKTKLARELEERIEVVNHPLFLPSNEEELLKYVSVLSQELNRDDVPQVVISFDRQTQDVFSFHVIVLRFASCDSLSIQNLLEKACPSYRWVEEKVKRIHEPKSAHFKEASIIKAVFPKAPFFRKDFSLDLSRARTVISAILSEAIGEYRDYNGGTLVLRQDAFASFKKGYRESEDSILERFFYSVEPAFMQTVMDSILLKNGYALLKSVIERDFDALDFAHAHVFLSQGLVLAIASPFLDSNKPIFQELFALRHRFSSFAFSSLWVGKIFSFTLFYSSPDTLKQQECWELIERMLLTHKKALAKEEEPSDLFR